MSTTYQGNIHIKTLDPILFKNISNVSLANAFRNIANHFDAVAVGAVSEQVTILSGNPVRARATLTSTGSASNAETASVCNVTITAKTSGADYTAGEFDISATAATQAANIAKCINQTAGFSGIVTATSALGVTTITAVLPGFSGNGLQISESLTNVTAAAFSGGTEPTSTTLTKGL